MAAEAGNTLAVKHACVVAEGLGSGEIGELDASFGGPPDAPMPTTFLPGRTRTSIVVPCWPGVRKTEGRGAAVTLELGTDDLAELDAAPAAVGARY